MTDAVGAPERIPFGLALVAPNSDEILGGLWAMSLWGSFYIHLLIVPDHGRRKGLGSELMRRAEEEARSRGCWHMWLETYDFEGRPFYERLGFDVFGQLDGPRPYYPRYFMRKELRSTRE